MRKIEKEVERERQRGERGKDRRIEGERIS